MKRNKFVKSIINVVFTMALMLNMMMIVGAEVEHIDSLYNVDRDDDRSPIIDGGIETPVIKFSSEYVICVDPSLDPPENMSCNYST